MADEFEYVPTPNLQSRTLEYTHTHYFRCPYTVGNVIKIHLKTPDELEATEDAKIIKVFEPFTLSCVVLIQMTCSTLKLEGNMVLKLYDRRFAAQLREDEKIRPWTQDREMEYHRFILGGRATKFISQLNNGETPGCSTWSAAMEETYLHDQMSDYYNAEVQAYNHMKGIQETDVPQLLASAVMCAPAPCQRSSEYVDIPGILLQHIEGFPLPDIAEHTPRESWQAICEDAIRIVHTISDLGILNEDVNIRSFIVRGNLKDGFKMVMIDFGLCKFRQDFEGVHEWEQWKANQDEEGAVGYVMQKRLKGGFSYSRSARYKRLDHTYKRDY